MTTRLVFARDQIPRFARSDSARKSYTRSVRSSLRLAPLLLLAIALIAATCNNGSTKVDSGIEGSVTIGPMCPVERPDSPCPDQPYAATIVINDSSGHEVARAQSGDDGRFRVALAPGSFTLVPRSPDGAGLPYASEQQVEVREGAYTPVTIAFDSGIR